MSKELEQLRQEYAENEAKLQQYQRPGTAVGAAEEIL